MKNFYFLSQYQSSSVSSRADRIREKFLWQEKFMNLQCKKEFLSRMLLFIIMNCAQYVNNIELLSSNLFGYVKGAFTGAYATTKGLLEAADGGMLFLDEVHRLNSESQEKLFVFLDQGIFRRMGESEGWHKAKSADGHGYHRKIWNQNFLRYIFKNEYLIVVQIPSLRERGEQERFAVYLPFFIEESKVLDKKMKVSGNVIEALLNHLYQGNIGDLENKIKF